jgi:AraC-like DNA-binding protein
MEQFDVKIISPAGGNVEVFQEIPDIYKHFSLPVFEKMYAKCSIGDMFFNYYSGDGFAIWVSVYQIKHSAIVRATGNFSVLELHIPFQNDLMSTWDGSKVFQLKNRQFELSFLPFVNNQSKFLGGQTHHTFDIHYTRDYLERFAEHYPLIWKFLEKVEKKEATSLMNIELFLSLEMITIIKSILQYDMRDVMAPFFFEGAILQFTTIFIEKLSGINQDSPKSFPKADRDKAEEVRRIIISDLARKYSIQQLAQKVGTNDCTLQQCFRNLYGVTIFQYTLSARMDYAKVLIRDNKNYTMQEVGEKVGYSESSNFSAAFKKVLGYTPEDFKKNEKVF